MPDPYYAIDRQADAGGSTVLRLTGELDINARDDVRAAILDAVAAGNDVRVDLGEVEFLDSEALSALIEGYRAATEAGRRFAVVNAGGPVSHVLRVSGALEVFERPTDAERQRPPA